MYAEPDDEDISQSDTDSDSDNGDNANDDSTAHFTDRYVSSLTLPSSLHCLHCYAHAVKHNSQYSVLCRATSCHCMHVQESVSNVL
jgi:hypothetical protein